MDRVLIAMRHSKSAWPFGVPDIERPLSKRGRKDAVVAGEVISADVSRPDLVVLSPSKRTRQTFKLIESALGPVRMVIDARVYASDWWDLLDVIRDVDDEVRTLMLLGHNPALEDLVREIAGSGGAEAMRQLSVKFPTSALAVLRGAGQWCDWGSGSAALDRLLIPRARK